MRLTFQCCVALGIVLAGCGSSAQSTAYRPSDAKPPQCAHATKAIPLPNGFPGTFPWPPGTTLTSSRAAKEGTIVAGIVPTTSFKDTAAFFKRQVAKNGFTVVYAEADPPRDAEGAYRGNGYAGRWTLQHIPSCATGITLQAFAQPVKQ
ncbi:MAG: hypothetical protein NVS4B2_28660 [Chloroflexota bacterium]